MPSAGERKVLALPRVNNDPKEAPHDQSCALTSTAAYASLTLPASSPAVVVGVVEMSQAENTRTEAAARIAELERIKTSLEEALGHAQRAYPPRGARRIEILIQAAIRETNVQIENLRSPLLRE
jgi:hypothetical protein